MQGLTTILGLTLEPAPMQNRKLKTVMGFLWSYHVHLTRMVIMKKEKRKYGEKNQRNTRRKYPRIEGHGFLECQGPLSTQNKKWGKPAPWHNIMKFYNTGDRTSSRLPAKEKKRKNKPTEQGHIKKDLNHYASRTITDSTMVPSKFWGKIISNLEFYNISKLSIRFGGK